MQLVIAEKPSVAMSIAKVIGATHREKGYVQGNGYLVSWCIGHLVELADPSAYGEYGKWRYEDLPIIPDPFQYVVKKQEQFEILKKLMHDPKIDTIVCATDAGREGELIFRYVYMMADCHKPFKRLWVSSMEDDAIKEGFMSLKDGHLYDHLYVSALCRAKADWLVGINATRLFSTLYHQLLNVGRVQTPTLYMIVQRDNEIKNFIPKKTYVVRVSCGDFEVRSDPFENIYEARQYASQCQQSNVVCINMKEEIKTINPPKLFDLTSLQREANRLFSLTAQQTLDTAQSLYEKKLITYPRTDSQFLTDDMDASIKTLVTRLNGFFPFLRGCSASPDIQRILNSKKVSDHHAIIPTEQIFKLSMADLNQKEKNILILIGTRLIMAVNDPLRYESKSGTFTCAGKELKASGRLVLDPGFKMIEQSLKKYLKSELSEDPDDKSKEDRQILPKIVAGQIFEVTGTRITEHISSPPRPYTEDTLLSAMERAGNEEMNDDVERKGLGTPATRAAIIEKLVHSGFVQRKRKQLLPTQDGIDLISIIPEKLTSPKLTAEWENELSRIAKGEASETVFMSGIIRMTTDLVDAYTPSMASKAFMNSKKQKREVIGVCPRCGSEVYENEKSFYCSNRDCKFAMWKNDYFFKNKRKNFTKTIARSLLKKGYVDVKGLYSDKTTKTYDARIVLDVSGTGKVKYNLDFNKE